MLRRIHLLRKLQARDDHLPGRFGEVGGGPAGPFGPLLPLLVVQLLDLTVCEVARPGPLFVELAHHGPDQALERSLGREHLHHAAAALYLAVRALLHVVRAQPLPVRRREGEVWPARRARPPRPRRRPWGSARAACRRRRGTCRGRSPRPSHGTRVA